MAKMTYLSFVFAASAFKGLVSQIGNADQSAHIANMYTVGIRHFKQSFSQKLCSTMSNLAISFHLSKTQTSVTGLKKRQKNKENFHLNHKHYSKNCIHLFHKEFFFFFFLSQFFFLNWNFVQFLCCHICIFKYTITNNVLLSLYKYKIEEIQRLKI